MALALLSGCRLRQKTRLEALKAGSRSVKRFDMTFVEEWLAPGLLKLEESIVFAGWILAATLRSQMLLYRLLRNSFDFQRLSNAVANAR